MRTVGKTLRCFLVLFLFCSAGWSTEPDPRSVLASNEIERVRINLNPWGPHLGVEVEVDGDHPGIEALMSLIHDAEASPGHKCANRGAIRLWLKDGGMVAIGLLPAHTEGLYQFRLYFDSHLEGVYSVRRSTLMAALEEFGVPATDPAFAE